jgi:ABC-type multidrug transport system fused ATPase/permease subunit
MSNNASDIALKAFCTPLSIFWYSPPPAFKTNSSFHNVNMTKANEMFDNVDLQLCFQETVVLYGISVVFAGLVALRMIFGEKRVFRIGLTWLNITKLVLCALLMVPAVMDLGKSIWQAVWFGVGTEDTPTSDILSHEKVAVVQLVTPVVFLIDMVLAGVLVLREKHLGVKSSGLQILFWGSLLLYEAMRVRSLSLIHQDDIYTRGFGGEWKYIDLYRFITTIVTFVLVLVQFVLALFKDRSKSSILVLEERPCPELNATFLSRITWWWLNGLIFHGYRKAIEYSNLWSLNPEDRSNFVGPEFEKEWEKELKKAGIQFGGGQNPFEEQHTGEPSLTLALIRAFGLTFFVAGFFKLAQDLLTFVSPQVLGLLINFIRDYNENELWKGFLYAAVMFFAAILQSLILHQYFHRCMVLGMRLRAAVIHAVYRKALRLSSLARKSSTTGEIVNLMAIDAQRFMDLVAYLHTLWSAPFQIALSIIFLYQTMGPSVFAGLAVMVLLLPANAVIAFISRKFQIRQMRFKDSRIKMMNEILNGIKVIKLYAWENHFIEAVFGIRRNELKELRSFVFLSSVSRFMFSCAPFFVAIVTFGTFVWVNANNPDPDGQLTSEKAFVALSLFNILRFPLTMLPMVVTNIVQASVSVKRLRTFLKKPELDPDSVDYSPEPPSDCDPSVDIDRGDFAWELPQDSTLSQKAPEQVRLIRQSDDEESSLVFESEDEFGETPYKLTLSKINLKVKQGQLVAVVGQVGAGKSSLLSAILGEMEKLQGRVTVRGRVAYVPQQAWIQNNTVKGNILFGKPMDGTYYDRTLRACALGPDLEILPGGDMAEIGEKGINLSGGQKQRVSIARAVYQKSDIYLLDDPLSAVDSHVGKHIFDEVIGPEGLLRTKTRILVTHGLSFLRRCDLIVVLDKGKIIELGTYKQLIDNEKHFAELMRTYAGREENEEDVFEDILSDNQEMKKAIEEELTSPPNEVAFFSDAPSNLETKRTRQKYLERRISALSDGDDPRPQLPLSDHTPMSPDKKRVLFRQISKQQSMIESTKETAMKKDEKTALIGEEQAETGNIKFSVFLDYARATSWIMALLVIVLNISAQGLSVGASFWLAAWSTQEDNDPVAAQDKTGENIGVYAALGFGQAIGLLLAAFALAIGGVIASSRLHGKLLKNVLKSPMSFFDTTPMGRVLNRFSKDIYVVDETIPRSLRSFISTLLNVLSTIIVIIVATPYFTAVIVPLLIVYFIIQRIYVNASRQLKRLESVSRSPIYSHFQETLGGVTTIRAYHKQEEFLEQSEHKVDYNQEAYYPGICANRWLAIRLEFIGNLVVFFAALFAVLAVVFPDASRTITPGLAGLSVSYALQVTASLNWMVRMTSELETNIVSVERIKEYTETPTEAPAIIKSNRPPSDWPQEGKVTFKDYSTRYRDGLDLVLKSIACNIPGGQKVGIVGRTGAGKSSLTMALFRIIEPANGQIMIDNIDVSQLGLYDLRSRITIIPQDPVLFSDTLRANLDPFNHHNDEEIWRALETAHLKKFVLELDDGLKHMVAEGGENLSVGQRQLVCLARALLRKTKILVLDEATAAVDMETDDFIQKTIRNEFADCTVVTIAHRLNTIMDYDRIMVLSDGRIAEFDSPNQLIAKKEIFYGMAKDAGLV